MVSLKQLHGAVQSIGGGRISVYDKKGKSYGLIGSTKLHEANDDGGWDGNPIEHEVDVASVEVVLLSGKTMISPSINDMFDKILMKG